jgi:D-tyrosyl-tRNA(Tyr) deacylase
MLGLRLLTDDPIPPSLSLKVFSNPSGDMWKANVKDIQGEILCVSQFTLMANTSKGNKPDFHRAMVRVSVTRWQQAALSFTCEKSADQSRTMYASFLQYMGTQYSPEKIKGILSTDL